MATVLAISLLLTAPAAAQTPRQRAEALLQEGNVLHDQKKYPEALARYRRARALYPSYKIDFNMALTLEAMSRLVEAAERLEGFLVQADDPSTTKVAMERRAGLRQRLGRIKVSCPVAGATVSVDGVLRDRTPLKGPIYVRPGAHELTVEAPGHAPHRRELEVAAGELAAVAAALVPLATPDPVPAPRPEPTPTVQKKPFYKKWWFWTVVGAVVVGGTVGVAVAATSGGEPGVGPGELDDIIARGK